MNQLTDLFAIAANLDLPAHARIILALLRDHAQRGGDVAQICAEAENYPPTSRAGS